VSAPITAVSGALVIDPHASVSEGWTLAERTRVALAMLNLIQADIYAGSYSVIGRPNITSIQHVFAEDAATLEEHRAHIEQVLAEGERGLCEWAAHEGRA
jgi:hypothetical protein